MKVVKREVSSFVNRLEVLTGWRFVCYKINGHNTPKIKETKQQVVEEARSRTRSEQKTSLPSLLSANRLRSLQPSLTTIQT